MEERLSQWHIYDKKRYTQEIELMKNYPFMSHYIDDETGNACWRWAVKCLDEDGCLYPKNCEYNPLDIIIECLHDYPRSMPLVYDMNDVLKRHGCIHINEWSNRICYWLRGTEDKCNFHLNDRIKNIVEQIGTFIYGQWVAEQSWWKWESDRPHWVIGILEYECHNGCISANDPCPCGKNATYFNCCLKSVEMLIRQNLRQRMWYIGDNYWRRKTCPCGSGKKYKDCCEWRTVFLRII